MKKPYFNNPRVKQSYQGPPRNRAERRAMAKNKGRRVEASAKLDGLLRMAKGLSGRKFIQQTLNLDTRPTPEQMAKIQEEAKKKAANLKRAITRRENQDIKRYLQAEEDRAEELNQALDTAARLQSGFKFGNGYYTQYLEPLMRRLKELGYDYDYNPNDDGNKNLMYKEVRFDRLPNDEEVNKYVKKILELEFSSDENYKQMKLNNTLAANHTLVIDNDLDKSHMNELIVMMKNSAAWAIASRTAASSDQRKENWIKMYTKFSEAYDNGLKSMVEDIIKHPDDYTIDTLETTITSAIREQNEKDNKRK